MSLARRPVDNTPPPGLGARGFLPVGFCLGFGVGGSGFGESVHPPRSKDVLSRLMLYGNHSPTPSFERSGTRLTPLLSEEGQGVVTIPL